MNRAEHYDRLLAKRWTANAPAPSSVYLPGHLQDVYRTMEIVLRCTADDQLRAFGLESAEYLRRFRRILLLAAAVHDLGKANDHFQAMIRRPGQTTQAIRHEWVTYYMLTRPEWSTWLKSAFDCEEDYYIALWCVSGHHPAPEHASPPTSVPGGAGSTMRLFYGHRDFRAAVGWFAEELSLPSPPQGDDADISLSGVKSGGMLVEIGRQMRNDSGIWRRLSDAEKKLTAAAKACLIGADVAGSALPRHSLAVQTKCHWLRKVLGYAPEPGDLLELVRERLTNQKLRPFQEEVTRTRQRVVLLRAGCGTGKTIAAYLWAARRCAGRRLYVCYPTTATATEGFRDYLFDSVELRSRHGARLFHSRAEVDAALLLHAEDLYDDEQIRIQSLYSWSTPVVCCTVDTVLGLLQNQRRGLYAWPALAQSAFVFDEVHAYDDRLFGTLLRFLEAMRGVPILLMTASLPDPHCQAIRDVLGKCGEVLEEVHGPSDLETLKRYYRWEGDSPHRMVREELARGGKVLWVCNTVDRAMEKAAELSDCKPLIYHSRFRYEDRVQRHADVINAFRREGPALAVCTQVAEMSLDLSATLLVTDLAPVPALIQRLGRLNRNLDSSAVGRPQARPFVVVEPNNSDGKFMESPYDRNQLGDWPAISRQWLATLGNKPVSQRDLAEAWRILPCHQSVAPVQSAWLDGGPRTTVDSVRDASPGLTVVLHSDADSVRAGGKRVMQVGLPMPPPPTEEWKSWPTIHGFRVAPVHAIAYDPMRGGKWRNDPELYEK
ncbi:MAG: CRISPR-associated helicase/endonuclease Cas3 [Pirellulaceae bacterium]|nr:MAG: CRISPR-associated helicase/endonuclease Cas3 [Pirellulaceae bacterium]